MFTGIIEELGTLKSLIIAGNSGHLTVKCRRVLEGTALGDSIAVNGVCLTVVRLGSDEFEADVMPETVMRSSLGSLKPGDVVNLERALALGGRMGGHIVQGHVDGVGTVSQIQKEGIASLFTITAPPHLLRYVVPKGSIAVDGVSLTVAQVREDSFVVSLIPHTGQMTNLSRKKVGDPVNLETDILGRYVEKLLFRSESTPEKASGLTIEFLKEHGF